MTTKIQKKSKLELLLWRLGDNREAENFIFCKILRIFSNSAQFTKFCENSAIAESWWDCLELTTYLLASALIYAYLFKVEMIV